MNRLKGLLQMLLLAMFMAGCAQVTPPDMNANPFTNLEDGRLGIVLTVNKDSSFVDLSKLIPGFINVVRVDMEDIKGVSYNPITHEMSIKSIRAFVEGQYKKDSTYNINDTKEIKMTLYYKNGTKQNYAIPIKLIFTERSIDLALGDVVSLKQLIGAESFQVMHIDGNVTVTGDYIIDAGMNGKDAQLYLMVLSNKNYVLVKANVKQTPMISYGPSTFYDDGSAFFNIPAQVNVATLKPLPSDSLFKFQAGKLMRNDNPIPLSVWNKGGFTRYDIPLEYTDALGITHRANWAIDHVMSERFADIQITDSTPVDIFTTFADRNTTQIDVLYGLPGNLQVQSSPRRTQISVLNDDYSNLNDRHLLLVLTENTGEKKYKKVRIEVVFPDKRVDLYAGSTTSLGANETATINGALPFGVTFDGKTFSAVDKVINFIFKSEMMVTDTTTGLKTPYTLNLFIDRKVFILPPLFIHEDAQVDFERLLVLGATESVQSIEGMDKNGYRLVGNVMTLIGGVIGVGDHAVKVFINDGTNVIPSYGYIHIQNRIVSGLFSFSANASFEIKKYITTSFIAPTYSLPASPAFLQIDNRGFLTVNKADPSYTGQVYEGDVYVTLTEGGRKQTVLTRVQILP